MPAAACISRRSHSLSLSHAQDDTGPSTPGAVLSPSTHQGWIQRPQTGRSPREGACSCVQEPIRSWGSRHLLRARRGKHLHAQGAGGMVGNRTRAKCWPLWEGRRSQAKPVCSRAKPVPEKCDTIPSPAQPTARRACHARAAAALPPRCASGRKGHRCPHRHGWRGHEASHRPALARPCGAWSAPGAPTGSPPASTPRRATGQTRPPPTARSA